MENIVTIINVLFIATIFFSIAFGILLIGIISLFGIIWSLHHKKAYNAIICILVFTFVHTGTTSLLDFVNKDGTSVEYTQRSKEDYIQNFLFDEETVIIERTEQKLNENSHRYNVMTQDLNLYQVDVYDDEAFGLYRYDLKEFNKDERK